MKKLLIVFMLALLVFATIDAKKLTSKSRSSTSSRGSNRKTASNPKIAPTSFSNVQASASKPSLFGWQTKPKSQSSARSRSHSYPSSQTDLSGNNKPKQTFSGWQTKPKPQPSERSQSHSYPSSQTGLSGGNKPKENYHQQNVQKSHTYPQNVANKQETHSMTQPANHGYPSSGGLSGKGQSAGYPNQGEISAQGSKSAPYPQSPTGLSGSNSPNYPQQNRGLSGAPSHSAPYPQSPTGLSGSNSPIYPQQNRGLSGAPSHTAGAPQYNQNSGVAPPPYTGYSGNGYSNNNYHHPQGPPPPYSSNFGPGYGGHSFGGHGHYNPGYGSQMPGYFGNYNSYGNGFGGVSRTSGALKGLGIAGAGIGTVLTGLALWNLARSTGHRHHTVIYDNRGQPVAVAPESGKVPEADSMLGDLINCTLTIENGNTTELIAIPCAIATSFSPDAKVNDLGVNNSTVANTKCIITVVTKSQREYTTTIPCSTLLSTAAENNVTEPVAVPDGPIISNSTIIDSVTEYKSEEATALPVAGNSELNKNLSCVFEAGVERDPINPCIAVTSNLTVLPLNISTTTTPSAA